MLRFGYNTNGFNCHSINSTLEIIAKIGYRCVALTIDHSVLNPWQKGIEKEIETVRKLLNRYSLSCVIETGARFLLDPWRKHESTFVSRNKEGRKFRLEFLKKSVDIGVQLNAEAVSFWSGKKAEDIGNREAIDWLVSGCRKICKYAKQQSMPLAFEPEPGMFIENMYQYDNLKEMVDHDFFGLTLDLGHAFITEDISVGNCILKYADEIKNVHIEDMKKGVHEHLFFGDGEMNFYKIFKALNEIRYTGPINVELSRHSHNAVETARNTMKFLNRFV